MPRPRRSKIKPSVVTTRPAIAANLPTKGQTPASEAEDLYNVSDQGGNTPRSSKRLKKTKTDDASAHAPLSRISVNRQQDATLTSATAPKSKILSRLEAENITSTPIVSNNASSEIHESSSPSIELSRREINVPASTDNSVLNIRNFRRRARQPSILEIQAAGTDGADLLDESDTDNRGRSTRQGTRPSTSGIRGMGLGLEIGTPLQRGPILQLGTARRRVRQPSILGSSRKVREPSTDSDELEDEIVGDFMPDGESTPFDLAKSKHTERRSRSSSGGASSSSKRKREISVDRAHDDPQPSIENREDAETIENASIPSSSNSRRSSQAHDISRPRTPDILSETMAPPESSSTSSSSRHTPIREIPSRRQQPSRRVMTAPRYDSDPPSSPPSLTHSPDNQYFSKSRSRTARTQALSLKEQPTSLSTAQLQALLPRRRHRETRNDFDLPSDEDDDLDVSHLAEEDDELSGVAGARPRRSTRPAPRQSNLRTPATQQRAPTATAARKASHPPPGQATPGPGASTRSAAKTYSRTRQLFGHHGKHANRQAVNGEVVEDDSLGPVNDPEEEETPETSQEREAKLGKELKLAKKRFNEVDKWQLDFEEVTASSSSPLDAR